MGWQIVKQPNDLWAIWTTIADGFILEDATEEELVEYWAEADAERGRRIAREWIEDCKKGRGYHGGVVQYDYETCKNWHNDDGEEL
jgi:hypothetical protein